MESITAVSRDGTEITILPAPCPFCASDNLRVVPWSDDSGDYDAVECCQCLGCAPADIWNLRCVRS